MFDHANIGPDYLPGHSHADNLSIEWSLGKQRVLPILELLYGECSERHRQRKLRANTVEVDVMILLKYGVVLELRGEHSVTRVSPEDSTSVSISGFTMDINAYGSVKHTRNIDVSNSQVKITDKLDGQWREACGYFHFHPDITVEQLNLKSIYAFIWDADINGDYRYYFSKSRRASEFGSTVDNTKCRVAFKKIY